MFFYGVIMTLLIVPTNYSVTAPGYNDNVSDTIYVLPSENANQEGSFHTTSVISFEEITIYQKWLGNALPKVTVEAMSSWYETIQISELQVMGRLMKDDSIQTSLIVGIAGAEKNITYTSYPTVYLTYRHLTPDTLQIGDSILSVNGNEDIFAGFEDVLCGEEAEVVIIRDEEVMTVYPKREETESQCSFGVYVLPYTIIEDTEVEYDIYDTNTGGPSGGLMQSLYIFNQLTDYDYSLGMKIGGTGTIDVDGNVGYIGGIREKIITAIGNDIDIFFVPRLTTEDNDNYVEAMNVLKEFDTDLIIIGVSTFDQAVAFLEGYGAAHE